MDKEPKKDWASLLRDKLPRKGVDTQKLQASNNSGLSEEDFGEHDQVLANEDLPSDPLARQTLIAMRNAQAAQQAAPVDFRFVGPAESLVKALSKFQVSTRGNQFGLDLGNQFRFTITAEANEKGDFKCHIALLMGYGETADSVGEVGSTFTQSDTIESIVQFADELHSTYQEVASLYSVLGAKNIRI